MARLAFREGTTQRIAARSYHFTVVFQQVVVEANPDSGGRSRRTVKSKSSGNGGYQVTVPMLPGLITYGRTLTEAREMATDAIRVHLEGLRRDGEPIPDETASRTEKLRVAISV